MFRRLRALSLPRNRAVLRELTRARFKEAHADSLLGLVFGLLSPTFVVLVLYAVFGRTHGEHIRHYPLYLLAGAVTVHFFTSTCATMVRVLGAERELLLNSTLMRETVILAAVGPQLYKFSVEILVCTGLSVLLGAASTEGLLAVVPLWLACQALTVGVGSILAVLYCFVREVSYVWTLCSHLLFVATPTFYRLSDLPHLERMLVTWLNPLSPIVTGFQLAFVGEPVPLRTLFHAAILAACVLLAGYALFLRFERSGIERI